MIPDKGYAALKAKGPLQPFSFERREVGENDVLIAIEYCGICHSDVHQARDEWGGSIFPMVPGHEIVGRIAKFGSKVTKFHQGDAVGVGCMVNSCRTCPSCKDGFEQFCDRGAVMTYNGYEHDGVTVTQGGYSTNLVVDQDFVLSIPAAIPLANAAPLLCAGITTYSPLRHWNVKPGDKVGVMGLGGLGHMAVKIAAAMGAQVGVISHSERKREDAMRMGAHEFIIGSDADTFKKYHGYFDLIVNTIAAPHGLGHYLSLLKRDGTMVIVGVPEKADELPAFPLILKRRRIAGSLIGGIAETQEMLNFCAEHGLSSDIELIPMDRVNEAYDRLVKGDVKYRFVIDIAGFRAK